MVVDDDESIHAALRLVLENHYDIITAASAEAAIRQLALHRVDIILLDLLMPGTDGWTLFEEVRAMNGHRPKVIFLTAVDSSRAAVAALKLGADDWILKPFEEEALVARLHTLLSETRRIRVRGGDLGARATIATMAFLRSGALAVYETETTAASASADALIDATGATTLEGLQAAIGSAPIRCNAVHRVTVEALHHVSRYYSEINVAGLAALISVKGNYLLERFRDDLGLTPREYVARIRIEVVKQRLRQTECPSLDRVAEEVGLCDAAHVHKLFARYAQGSPSAYRGNVQDRR